MRDAPSHQQRPEGGPSLRDRQGGRVRGGGGGWTVRKLSPYDVFPPSQRRLRRDTGEGGRVRVGVMENRRRMRRRRAAHAERRGVGGMEVFLSLVCGSSAHHISRSEVPPAWTCWIFAASLSVVVTVSWAAVLMQCRRSLTSIDCS